MGTCVPCAVLMLPQVDTSSELWAPHLQGPVLSHLGGAEGSLLPAPSTAGTQEGQGCAMNPEAPFKWSGWAGTLPF